jgi:hypothetical protein
MQRIRKAGWTIPASGAVCLLAVLCLAPAARAATLAGPLTWASPDQPWGARRAVTAEDRATIAAYRSGRKAPILSTDFTSSVEFAAHWSPVSDDIASLKSRRRPPSVEPSPAGLQLKILLTQDCRTPRWSTGYIASKTKSRLRLLRGPDQDRRHQRLGQRLLADD